MYIVKLYFANAVDEKWHYITWNSDKLKWGWATTIHPSKSFTFKSINEVFYELNNRFKSLHPDQVIIEKVS